MRISILTATWHYNLWDELILLQEYKLLQEYFPKDTKFNIFTYDSDSSLLEDDKNISYVTYFPKNIRKSFLSNISHLWNNIRSIYDSDIIVFGWGGIIYDSEVQKSNFPILQWKFRIFLAKIFLKKIVWLAVWISVSDKNISKLKYLFKWSKTLVSVRDESSQNVLKKLHIDSKRLYDPVFSYVPQKNKIDLSKKNKTVWISLRRWYLQNEARNIKQMILFLSKKWYDIVFLSHSIHDEDMLANDLEFLKPFLKKYWIRATKTISETLNEYQKLDFCISMRLHSQILSVVHNVPFLAISYWKKTDELMKILDYDKVINPRNFNFEEFIKQFSILEREVEGAKFALNTKYDKIKSEMFLEYNNFFDGLEMIKR